MAIAPDGTVAAAELGTGRVISIRSGQVEVIASGLRDPIGVAVAPDGEDKERVTKMIADARSRSAKK